MAWPPPGRFNSGVRQEPGHLPDWRDAAAYAPLLEAGRAGFAWEWLRRDPAYRAAAGATLAQRRADVAVRAGVDDSAARWGLHAFEDPNLTVPNARPLWTASVDAGVLPAVAAAPGPASDAFRPERFAHLSTIGVGREGREHLLLSDGLRFIRLDILAGTVMSGPAQLHYLLTGTVSAERPLATLRQLLALDKTGRFARSLHRPEARARRWQRMLRAHDGLADGADQREIAALLLSRSAEEPRWRSSVPSLRSQAQRLARSARRMAAGGYRALLG